MTTQDITKMPILVTGASGYIASWIIQYLLAVGHTVHGTVRDPNKEESVKHLKKIAENKLGTLHLFAADLLKQGSFDEAMKGCGIVIHTASPFLLDGFEDANEALVRPAVEGTRNVLEAANRTVTVEKVVLTSSVVSVYGDCIDAKDLPNHMLNESHWNESSSVNHSPYNYSKVAAEREAWRIQKEQSRWALVTINPGLVFGPSLTTLSQSASIDTLVSMGDGRLKTGVPDLVSGVVDVRDVARAHVLAALDSKASGRYLVVADSLKLLDIAKILRTSFGDKYPFPRMTVPKFIVWAVGPILGPITRDFVSRNVGHPMQFDNSRSLTLGLKYHTLEQTFTEHFQQLLNDGLVKKRA
ncbi:NAD-dependent epimerase/dehydratase family protein [Acinetobacter sp. XH1639]|uniref:NAD-dependent epimerase/dehydratase family protein n=1 Tax=Acinetobacter sp. XH1639 TaxID=3157368 RepID=UPI0032B37A16